jgi:hypothetical protein
MSMAWLVYVSHASVGQLTRQMSQMSISMNPPTTAPTSQNVTVPTQTSDIHLVQSTNPKNAQQPRGKEEKERRILILGKGLSLIKMLMWEA